MRLGRRRGAIEHSDGTLELHVVDSAILADELSGFGPEVVVVEPESLVRAVRERLERTVADHG
jgi:proteasome accessory factor B